MAVHFDSFESGIADEIGKKNSQKVDAVVCACIVCVHVCLYFGKNLPHVVGGEREMAVFNSQGLGPTTPPYLPLI